MGKKPPHQKTIHPKNKRIDETHHVEGSQSPKPIKNFKAMKHDMIMTYHNML